MIKKPVSNLAQSPQTIERICVYRNLLLQLQTPDKTHISSDELSQLAKMDASQVRRDLIMLKCMGTLSKGYKIADIVEQINGLMNHSETQNMAVIGVGNLGRAIMSFFSGRHPHLNLVAGFDSDPAVTGKIVHGCLCYNSLLLESVVKRENISIAVVTVPDQYAQEVIDKLVSAGVKSILNFTHIRPQVPDSVFISDVCLSAHLDVAAYYAKQNN